MIRIEVHPHRDSLAQGGFTIRSLDELRALRAGTDAAGDGETVGKRAVALAAVGADMRR